MLRVWSPEAAFAPNRMLSTPIARLALLRGARPQASIARLDATTLRVDLTAETYLAFVHLTARRPDLRFSDNHFDLDPGEMRAVIVMAPAAIGPDDIVIRCWNDREG